MDNETKFDPARVTPDSAKNVPPVPAAVIAAITGLSNEWDGRLSPVTGEVRDAPVVISSHSADLKWAVERWRAEVASRPLGNIYRRTLDSVWRQVINRFGGDDVALCGPRHDELVRGPWRDDLTRGLPAATDSRLADRKWFLAEIEEVINRNGANVASDTPAWVMAEYLEGCVAALSAAFQRRSAVVAKTWPAARPWPESPLGQVVSAESEP